MFFSLPSGGCNVGMTSVPGGRERLRQGPRSCQHVMAVELVINNGLSHAG
jgi:hypothetical protein